MTECGLLHQAGWSAVHAACDSGHAECLELLIEAGLSLTTLAHGEVRTRGSCEHSCCQCVSMLTSRSTIGNRTYRTSCTGP